MSDGIRAASVDDLAPGEALVLDTEVTGTEEPISIFRDDDGTFYAMDDTCSHEEASLAEGWVEGGEVECPLHSARFCLSNGQALCLPATEPVRAHRVDVRGNDVYVFPGEPPTAQAQSA